MKAIMVALLACVLVPAMALAQEGQAQGNLNTITGVNVTGGRVEIVGTKKPNFTTFTMTDPPRLVIDISEAVFSGVKEDLTVGNGTITGIRTASYGSDDSAIARVLIGYEREVETDIKATGNSLVVTVAGGGGAAVAERPTTAPGTAPAATAPAGTAPAAAATAPGVSADQAAAAAQVDRQQQEKAAAQAAAAAQADRQQQEKAAAQAAAAAQADAEAQRQAQSRAEADRKAQDEASRAAAQQAEQRRLQEERAAKEAASAAEKQRQQDEARASAEQKQRQQADDKARREAEAQAAADAKKRQQDEARAAAAEEKKRLAAEGREARSEEAQAAAEERRRQQAEARQTRVAQAETPRRAPEQGDSADVSSRRKTMTLVGFKQEPASSRVFVRTNEPVRYTVTEGNKEVVLELENTRIAESNNTLALNTAFFDTAVAAVDPGVGPSRSVRVSIKLKEQVAYETRQEGNEVSIEFQRPSRR